MLSTVHALWLQDGMQTRWPAPAVARHVERQLRQTPCDMVGSSFTQPQNAWWCWRDSQWKADGADRAANFKHIQQPEMHRQQLTHLTCSLQDALHPLHSAGLLQVLTFDACGVSGHLNHRGVHQGVR